MKTLQERVHELLEKQKQDWDLAAKNYRGLQKVQKRQISLGDGVEVGVQFNPERIYSSAAKVDDKSIRERKCFLCQAHLPEQQRWVDFEHEYLILVNPFPIFPLHLTIPILEHAEQRIAGRMHDMLMLARLLDDFVVFYNGPRCGASAPDHFHFQAGNKGFMPIEDDFEKQEKSIAWEKNGVVAYHFENYFRSCLVLEGNDQDLIAERFYQLLKRLREYAQADDEPMVNVLVSWNDEKWRTFVFPRQLHRPRQYFAEGDSQIVLSPASVDLGGVLITPREADYHKMNADIIKDIFQQVCFDDGDFRKIVADCR